MNKNYASLNKAQQEAINCIQGVVMVVAGPGTGKTTLLTARIAHILKQADALADNILCLTFTNSAVDTMQKKLKNVIGEEATKVNIHTFHGFCDKILHKYKDRCPQFAENMELVDSLEQFIDFRAAIDGLGTKLSCLRKFNNLYFYQNDFFPDVSLLRLRGASPDSLGKELDQSIKEIKESEDNFYKKDFKDKKKRDWKPGAKNKCDTKIQQMRDFILLWQKYEEIKQKRGHYDFNDQLYWVVQLLEDNDEIKRDLQEQYQYIMVDEYQDTNEHQNQILFHLGDYALEGEKPNPNILVVGDDDQSIYSFQGATVQTMQNFAKHYPDCQKIFLTTNYRSTQLILDVADKVINNNAQRISQDKKLISSTNNQAKKGLVKCREMSNRDEELQWILTKVQQASDEGYAWEEMAILAYTNKEVIEIADYLDIHQIKVNAKIKTNVLHQPWIKSMIRILQVLHNPSINTWWLEMLHDPAWEVPTTTLFSLAKTSKKQEDFLQMTTDSRDQALSHAGKTISRWLKDYAKIPLADLIKNINGNFLALNTLKDNADNVFTRIEKQQGAEVFLQWITKHAYKQNIQSLQKLEYILTRLHLHQELSVPLKEESRDEKAEGVSIMTAHSAKGREFDVVLVTGLKKTEWNRRRKSSSLSFSVMKNVLSLEDNFEELRRLFYVCMTRAREQLYISCVDNQTKNPQISLYTELPDNLVEVDKTPLITTGNQNTFTPDSMLNRVGHEQIQHIVDNFVWSPTSLQAFLNCPRGFFYERILSIDYYLHKNNRNFIYGNLMHKMMEELINQTKEKGALLPWESWWAYFQENLETYSLPDDDAQEVRDYAKQILSKYWHDNQNLVDRCQNWEMERTLKAEFEYGDNTILMSGRIDKVEWNTKKNQVCLVDYKTSAIKSAIIKPNTIWGRQLLFYYFLAQKSGKITPCNTAIESLSLPAEDEDWKRQEFNPTEEDLQIFETELISANSQLKELHFPMVGSDKFNPAIDYWQSWSLRGWW